MADRYLLESGAPDGYLLEDGTGVLLLEVPTDPAPLRVAAAPQQTTHRALAGYALAFAAAGALAFAPTPQAIGAANYTVGTHRAAIAAAHPKPQTFRAVIPTAAAADTPVARYWTVPAQTTPQPAPYVHGTPPASVAPGADTPIGRYRLTIPQYPEQGRPWVRGTAPASVAEVFSIARSFAAEQDVWNVVAPQWFGRQVVEGPPPSGTDTIGALAYTVGTQRAAWAEANGRGTWVRGTPPASVVPDTPTVRPLFAAPQPPVAGFARLYGPTPEPLAVADIPPPRWWTAATQVVPTGAGRLWPAVIPDTPAPSFRFTYQAVVDTAQGRVWGRPVVGTVVGTDVAIGVFRAALQQFYVPPAFGSVQRMDVDAIGPPPVVVPGVDEWLIRARRLGRR